MITLYFVSFVICVIISLYIHFDDQSDFEGHVDWIDLTVLLGFSLIPIVNTFLIAIALYVRAGILLGHFKEIE